METILIFSRSYISRDPRVLKQIDRLKRRYKIICLGYGPYADDDIRYFNLVHRARGSGHSGLINKIVAMHREGRLLYAIVSRISRVLPSWFPLIHTWIKDRVLLLSSFSKDLRNVIETNSIDLIIANDFSALSICINNAGEIPVLYDAHEYSLGQASQNKKWIREHYPYIQYSLRKYLKMATCITTVSDGIADEYKTVFDLSKRPTVIRNVSPFIELKPQLENEIPIKLVHHGVAARQRALEYMIDVVEALKGKFELHFYLVASDERYLKELKGKCGDLDYIKFHNPVPTKSLTSVLNQYDIGFYILPPANFNQIHALPNKIFEFIQARLAIAIGPSPEMERIVKEHGVGLVAKDFSVEAMVQLLDGISLEEVNKYKMNSDACAFDLSASVELEKLEQIVNDMIVSHTEDK